MNGFMDIIMASVLCGLLLLFIVIVGVGFFSFVRYMFTRHKQ